MSSTRQLKYARLVQKELSGIFQKGGSSLYGNALVTITQVRISPDLLIAKVYLSILGKTDSKEIFERLQSHTGEIRRNLGDSIRHQVRRIPELEFFLDDSAEYADNIERILKKVRDEEKGE